MQEAVTGYCGCSTCLVHFDQGPGGAIYSTARRMLSADHPLRQQTAVFQGNRFVFRSTETRGEPLLKTTQRILHLDFLRRRNNLDHYLGQKGPPMLMSLKGPPNAHAPASEKLLLLLQLLLLLLMMITVSPFTIHQALNTHNSTCSNGCTTWADRSTVFCIC